MADKVTSESTVQMTMEFGDGSERTISQTDPTSTNLVEKINAFGNFAVENNIFKSEKSDATISRIKSAKVVGRTVTDFDLS